MSQSIYLEMIDFCKKYNFPLTMFGRIVAKDSRLIGDVKLGRTLRPELLNRVRAYMKNYDGTMYVSKTTTRRKKVTNT